jgi:hypothetical protein
MKRITGAAVGELPCQGDNQRFDQFFCNRLVTAGEVLLGFRRGCSGNGTQFELFRRHKDEMFDGLKGIERFSREFIRVQGPQVSSKVGSVPGWE